MAIILPTVIQGPAYILHGGVVQYVEDDIAVEEVLESWTPKTTFGDAGPRHKSRMFKLSYKPVGMLTSGLLNYFYEAHLAPQTYVGQSIIPASNYAVTICSLTENKTYGYVRGGLGAPPDLFCGPTGSLFGQAQIWCLGNVAVAPTNANFLKAAISTITPDTSFDASKIKSDIYSGVLGALSAPLNALGAMNGFMFKFGFKPKTIVAADVGIADVILEADGFNLTVQFAPSNLTEAQLDTWLNYQGANAVLPGQSYGGSATGAGDLVLTGQVFAWIFTAKQVGPRSLKRIYKIGEHRFPAGALEMVNQLTNTTGVPNPLFAFTAGT
ncbi:MAG: hypothetical protein P4N60_19140 [Verrucomicrobiae bacterium]|nr:hypothetical protein [Verrucomicrobiae bacterium]